MYLPETRDRKGRWFGIKAKIIQLLGLVINSLKALN